MADLPDNKSTGGEDGFLPSFDPDEAGDEGMQLKIIPVY